MRPSTAFALYVIIFGGIVSALGEAGVYDVTLASSNIGLSENDVTEITEGLSSTGVNDWTIVTLMLSIGKVAILGIFSAISIIPLGLAYDLPVLWLMPIQLAIWFVYVADRVGWIGGRDL